MFKSIINFFKEFFTTQPAEEQTPNLPSSKDVHYANILAVIKHQLNDETNGWVNYRVRVPDDIANRIMTFLNVVAVSRGVIMTVVETNKYATTFDLKVYNQSPNSGVCIKLLDTIFHSYLRVFDSVGRRTLIGTYEPNVNGLGTLSSKSAIDRVANPNANKQTNLNIYQYRYNGHDVSISQQHHSIEHGVVIECLNSILQFIVGSQGLVSVVNETSEGIDVFLLD